MNTKEYITNLDEARFPEASKLKRWFDSEKAEGLIDVKFYPGDLTDETLESFCKAANELQAAEAIPHPELI